VCSEEVEDLGRTLHDQLRGQRQAAADAAQSAAQLREERDCVTAELELLRMGHTRDQVRRSCVQQPLRTVQQLCDAV